MNYSEMRFMCTSYDHNLQYNSEERSIHCCITRNDTGGQAFYYGDGNLVSQTNPDSESIIELIDCELIKRDMIYAALLTDYMAPRLPWWSPIQVLAEVDVSRLRD